jgi:hypothetical protein
MTLSKRKECNRVPCGNIEVNKMPQRERGAMKIRVGERRSPGTCATHLFDALTLKPCSLELARALHVAGHAHHAPGRHRILALASIDIHRIAGAEIAEHWQVVQPTGTILAKAVAPTRRSATRNITSKANQKHPEKPDMRENLTC